MENQNQPQTQVPVPQFVPPPAPQAPQPVQQPAPQYQQPQPAPQVLYQAPYQAPYPPPGYPPPGYPQQISQADVINIMQNHFRTMLNANSDLVDKIATASIDREMTNRYLPQLKKDAIDAAQKHLNEMRTLIEKGAVDESGWVTAGRYTLYGLGAIGGGYALFKVGAAVVGALK